MFATRQLFIYMTILYNIHLSCLGVQVEGLCYINIIRMYRFTLVNNYLQTIHKSDVIH